LARTATLTIHGPLERADLPCLIERTRAMFEQLEFEVLRCELRDARADAVTVDALARVALVARRSGRSVRLSGAPPQLRVLVALMGLAGALPCEEGL
jgi:ABC-type transporter Mla MlaB component